MSYSTCLNLIFALCMFCHATTAKEYFIAVNGSDSNNGDRTTPFRTIVKASEVARPGDNRINIKVIGEMANTTGPFFFPDTIKASVIPGEYYCFLPCGLYKDFIVEQF